MCAQNNAKYSRESDASEDTHCFLITVGKDRQIGLEKADTNPETSPNRLCIGKCSPNIKPKLKNRIASLRQDSQKINDIHVGSRECRAALSMDKTNKNIQRLDEIQNAGSPPRFITICDRILANSPSFLVLKDTSTRNETRENQDYSNLNQSESIHPQQQTVPPVIRSNAGCQTDEMCCQGDVASCNNSCHEGNDVPSTRNLSQPTTVPIPVPHIQFPVNAEQTQFEKTEKEAEGAPVISLQAQLQPLTQEIQQQQQQQNSASSQAPYMTISFKPLPQAGSTCGTSVAPCQQFPSAARSNASSCSFCTSNCCLPRPPQVCQMPKTACCFPGLSAPQNLSSCLLTPYGHPCCCCSRSISCWSAPGPQHQSSLGFPGHFKRGGMVVSNQISHRLFQPVLSTTCFAPRGSFQSGIHPCLSQLMPTCNPCSHCPINIRHYPHCNCAGFLNNQQQCPLQMGQQCPMQMRQQYPSQMGQLPLLGHQDQCNVCSLKQKPKKAIGSEVSGDEGLNRDGLLHVFSKVPQESSRARTQPLSEDQEHQEETANNKSCTGLPRAYGGAAEIKNTFNSNALFAARSGRTCLILRPTATAMVPRLLTRRISRYTSVIMAPK